jgi:hypothetical protein
VIYNKFDKQEKTQPKKEQNNHRKNSINPTSKIQPKEYVLENQEKNIKKIKKKGKKKGKKKVYRFKNRFKKTFYKYKK